MPKSLVEQIRIALLEMEKILTSPELDGIEETNIKSNLFALLVWVLWTF